MNIYRNKLRTLLDHRILHKLLLRRRSLGALAALTSALILPALPLVLLWLLALTGPDIWEVHWNHLDLLIRKHLLLVLHLLAHLLPHLLGQLLANLLVHLLIHLLLHLLLAHLGIHLLVLGVLRHGRHASLGHSHLSWSALADYHG